MRTFINSILIVLMLALVGCKSGTSYSDGIPTDNTVITKLTFAADDKNPGIENAAFTIELIGDTGAIIYNKDSLPVGTKIDAVVSQFTFQYSIAGMVRFTKKDTTVLRNNDTIDYTEQPLHLRIISTDYSKTRNYWITVLVHNINPDLYRWTLLSDKAIDVAATNQVVVRRGDAFMWFAGDGSAVYRYTSEDCTQWHKTPVTGLPNGALLRCMAVYNDRLYLASGGWLYESADGIAWEQSVACRSLLGVFGDDLWCAVDDGDGLASCTLAQPDVLYPLPQNFPVQGDAHTQYLSPTGQPQYVALGGVDAEGRQLNTRWLTQDMRHWVNLSAEQPIYAGYEGAAVIAYGGRLLLVGGVDKDGKLRDNFVMQSFDDGLYWEAVNSADLALPEQFTSRAYTSVLTSADGNDLYFFGGTNLSTALSDVWKARKNSIDWE